MRFSNIFQQRRGKKNVARSIIHQFIPEEEEGSDMIQSSDVQSQKLIQSCFNLEMEHSKCFKRICIYASKITKMHSLCHKSSKVPALQEAGMGIPITIINLH